MESDSMQRASRNTAWTMFIGTLLIATVTAILVPTDAYGAFNITDPEAGKASLADTTRLVNSLPSGRWGGIIGTVSVRIDDAGVGALAATALQTMGTTVRLIMPNMLLTLMQVCWSSAIHLSQFAVSFDPLDKFGHQIDRSTAQLVDSIFAGGVVSTILAVAVIGLVCAAAFQYGKTRSMLKRLFSSILVAALLFMTGAAAANSTDDAPATGSPWWIVKTINGTINSITGTTIPLDAIGTDAPTLMAYNRTDTPNCQTYLQKMHDDYRDKANAANASEASNVTTAINRMWEETALRSWVTTQWGSPTADGVTTNEGTAANAQQAYCHVLEASAGTDVNVQADLTSRQLGLASPINERTAARLFSTDGYIDPYVGQVNKDDTSVTRSENIKKDRMGVLWETCATDATGKPIAREGWNKIVTSLGQQGIGEIKNGGKSVRSDWSWLDESIQSPERHPLVQNNGDAAAMCNALLTNQAFQSDGSHPGQGAAEGLTIPDNVADSVMLGWRTDIPNVGGTWSLAGLDPTTGASVKDNSITTDTGTVTVEQPAGQPDGNVVNAATTLDHLYGNADTDTLGMVGSFIGAIVNMIVWGFFSLMMIVCKTMLPLMAFFFVFAAICQMFTFSNKMANSLKNWAGFTCQLSCVGIVYTLLGTVSVFICTLIEAQANTIPGSFLYYLLLGISPLFALLTISLFFTQVLKKDNPFSPKGIMKLAGGGMLMNGITTLGKAAAWKNMMSNATKNMRFRNRAGRHSENNRATDQGRQYTSNTPGTLDTNRENNPLNDYMAAQDTTSPTAERWAAQGEDTVRGSLAPAAQQQHNRKERFHDRIELAQQEYEDKAQKRTRKADKAYRKALAKGYDAGDAESISKDVLNRQEAKDGMVKAAKNAGAGISLAAGTTFGAIGAAAKSRPLREAVKHGAKAAALTGLGAAALSNPITAPAGLMMLGRVATDRSNLRTVGNVARSAWDAARKALGRYEERAAVRSEILKYLENDPSATDAKTKQNPFAERIVDEDGTVSYASTSTGEILDGENGSDEPDRAETPSPDGPAGNGETSAPSGAGTTVDAGDTGQELPHIGVPPVFEDDDPRTLAGADPNEYTVHTPKMYGPTWHRHPLDTAHTPKADRRETIAAPDPDIPISWTSSPTDGSGRGMPDASENAGTLRDDTQASLNAAAPQTSAAVGKDTTLDDAATVPASTPVTAGTQTREPSSPIPPARDRADGAPETAIPPVRENIADTAQDARTVPATSGTMAPGVSARTPEPVRTTVPSRPEPVKAPEPSTVKNTDRGGHPTPPQERGKQ